MANFNSKIRVLEDKNNRIKKFLLLLCLLLCLPWKSSAAESVDEKVLLIYYSRSGKSKVVAETLQQHINTDILEITERKDRSGTWGFCTAALDSMFDRQTTIEPQNPDFSSYSAIVVVTPIWNWKISTPIRTLILKNRFDGKKLVFYTTANIDIKKYEKFGDEAPFIKRLLRDYLRGKRDAMRSLVSGSGAELTGHYHIATQDLTKEQIKQATVISLDYLKRKLVLP